MGILYFVVYVTLKFIKVFMENIRNNHWVRMGVIIFLLIVVVIMYFRNVDINNLGSAEGVKQELGANYMPDSIEKKVELGLFATLLTALGLEVSHNDFDVKKLVDTKGDFKASKVLRDKSGNIISEADVQSGKVQAKYTNEYNCDDFKTQDEAQSFYLKAGGPNEDVNRLDGNNDGTACQSLPKTAK